MKRLFALVAFTVYLAPTIVAATTIIVTIAVSTPQGGQPPSVTVVPNASVPAVAVALTATAGIEATVTAIKVQRVGSAGDGAIASLKVVDTTNTTLGTGTLSGSTATIPVTLSIPAGERRTAVVFITAASNLTPFQGQFANINITNITTSAVVSGALPLFGAQLSFSSGVAKPACQITATPSSYSRGQTVTLRWSSTNATGGSITGLGSVAPSGQQGILPTGTGNYVGTFTGPGGTGTCSTLITLIDRGTGGIGDTGGVDKPGGFDGPGGIGGTGGTGGTATSPAQPNNTGSTGTGIAQVCNGVSCQICNFASLGQKIINTIIGLSIPLAAVMFAWAGIMYFTSAASPSNIERAKGAFKVAFLGFLIAISAWLVFQTIAYFVLNEQQYRNWNDIQCVDTNLRPGTTDANSFNLGQILGNFIGGPNTRAPVAVGGMTGGGLGGPDGGLSTRSGYVEPSDYKTCYGGDTLQDGYCQGADGLYQPFAQSSSSVGPEGACPAGYAYAENAEYAWCQGSGGADDYLEPQAVGGASTGGSRGYAQCMAGNTNCDVTTLVSLGLSERDANIMSCIAITESSGVSNKCSGTGPCGTFQISKTNWRQYAPTGCSAADFGGNIIAAQNNASCNARTMVIMVDALGYQPWTGNMPGEGPWNPYAQTCVRNYSGI